MTSGYLCNQVTASNGTSAMWQFKAALKTAGWTVPWSGNGDGSGADTHMFPYDLVTSASGEFGLGNYESWFVIREPSGYREYCIQRGLNDSSWRIKYSVSGSFDTNVAGEAEVVPPAVDEVIKLGGGSDDGPVYAQLFPTDGTYRWQWGINQESPYCFWSFAYAKGSSATPPLPTCAFIHDSMMTGTLQSADIDPFCQLIGYHASLMLDGYTIATVAGDAWNPAAPTAQAFTGWTKKGLSGAKYGYIQYGAYVGYNGNVVVPTDSTTYIMGTNPYNSAENPLPLMVLRCTAVSNPGLKGWSKMLLAKSSTITNHETGDILALRNSGGSTSYYILAHNIWLPWSSTARTLK